MRSGPLRLPVTVFGMIEASTTRRSGDRLDAALVVGDGPASSA
jgi:hypothetical protein